MHSPRRSGIARDSLHGNSSMTGPGRKGGPTYTLRRPLGRDVLLRFLSEVLVTNRAAQ